MKGKQEKGQRPKALVTRLRRIKDDLLVSSVLCLPLAAAARNNRQMLVYVTETQKRTVCLLVLCLQQVERQSTVEPNRVFICSDSKASCQTTIRMSL